MIRQTIQYFAHKHLAANIITLVIFIGGNFAWHNTSKEEMPDVTSDTVRVSVNFPGASAQDVEYFVTKPIEEMIRGIDGVFRVESTSSIGSSSISVELQRNYPNIQEAFAEIRSAVLDVDLPAEILDDPSVRMFKTSKKAIIDVGMYFKDVHLLRPEERLKLQQYMLALENHLLNVNVVNSVNRDGYRRPEIHIKTEPKKLLEYRIPFNTAMNEIKTNHVRKPAGNIEAPEEPKVTLLSELDTPEELSELIIQGGFEGQVVRLGTVAEIERDFEKARTITKVNGHEGIILSVVKNPSYGILEALEAVAEAVEEFKKNNLEGSSVEAVLLDDESIDIRNRLSLIGMNGAMGFFLILGTLFIFLNKRSGFWVAMGIPFTICFTLLAASFLGYTVNGTTLAAVIIVMGIVVDDAIVIAENITRLIHKGVPEEKAVVEGTASVALPVVASVLTTCIAFVPLFFFTGRFGKFIEHIPPIIFLMLGASLLESILILPSHMHLKVPFISGFLPGRKKQVSGETAAVEHWFDKVEEKYGRALEKVLPYKGIVFGIFLLLLLFSFFIAKGTMKFVMFPNEETRDIVLMGEADAGAKRYETAELTKDIENIIAGYLGKEVVGFRTKIAESRRGGAVEENKFRMIIEIVPREKRRKSADQLIAEFKKETDKIQGFKRLVFQKSRNRQDSGSPIEIIVQESNDERRAALAAELAETMKEHPALTGVEIEQGLRVPEYRIDIDRDKVKRLSIDPTDIASTFRAALEGSVLYEFSEGDEDVYVRFSIIEEAKGDIDDVLSLPVENRGNYLVPLRDIVKVEKIVSPNSVTRRNLKRTAYVYADIQKGSGFTPLTAAEDFEKNIFPKLLAKYPSSAVFFGGEVQDTRESQGDLKNAVIMALLLIYVVLAILFNSSVQPLIIMLSIPFGVVGVILAFWLHGITLFGFYAAVGTLGLAGVVINDSIVMLSELNGGYDNTRPRGESERQIASISKTRLRAVLLTTLTTVAGVLPTAYGFAGYDAVLAQMMLALSWGLVFGTLITLLLIPCVYSLSRNLQYRTLELRR